MAKGGRELAECNIDMQQPTVIHLRLCCESPLLLIAPLCGVSVLPCMCM